VYFFLRSPLRPLYFTAMCNVDIEEILFREVVLAMRKTFVAFLFVALTVVFASVAFAADKPVIEDPLIVTTCGQSPGAVMVKMSSMQAGFKAEHNNNLTAADIKGKGYKTLIVTSGTSMKGMGAAGTNVDKEIARVQELMEAAKAEGMLVIGAHVEGMARRTDQSDQASIDAVLSKADAVLATVDSDSDGYFTKYAEEHNIPIIKVKDALGIGQGLKN